MKMYLPFGDWSGDGHHQYEKVLIEAPSMEVLLEAQKKITAKYGEYFFENFANDYQESYLRTEHWQALIDTNYPISRFIETEEVNDWSGCMSFEEVLNIDPNPCLSLEFIIDAFIWLLNTADANIIRLDKAEEIPTINNWTCPGFETVGYGCFD